MKKNTKIFIIIFAVWLIIILGFIGSREYVLRSGEKVLLKTAPVDPRDLFRGDYVILNYDISMLDLAAMNEDNRFSADDTVYVRLEKSGKYHEPASVSKFVKDDGIYIRGRVKSDFTDTLVVEYGIESYFVPEGEGKVLERARLENGIDVEVSVDKYGTAGISRLFVDGEEVGF